MLAHKDHCTLTVVPMKGWKRTMTFPHTGLPWVPSSPHVPRENSSMYYVSTGVLGELGVISEGVGYTLPFEVLAAEWIDPLLLADRMNALNLPGVIFRPITFKPFYGGSTGKTLHGVQIHLVDEQKVDLLGIQFYFLQVHQELYPDKSPFRLAESDRIKMFDKVMGTSRMRTEFIRRYKYEDIRVVMESEAQAFALKSKKFLLY
jgi:uncharacterized protein YbbC (DUF1343 family)